MKYDVCIVCAENDFYLGDMICQELEARGKTCRFNLRDANSPTDLGSGWFMSSCSTYIAVVNQEFINTLKYNKLTEAKTHFEDDGKAILFLNEDGVEIPSKWKHYISVDANAGWEEEFMDAIANGGSLEGLYTPYGEEPQPVVRRHDVQSGMPAMFDEEGYPTTANFIAQVYGTMPEVTTSKEQKAATVITERSEAYDESVGLRMATHEQDQIQDLLLPDAPASITVKRSLKYLMGDGVVRDVNRAISLMNRGLAEDPEDAEALYYLGAFEECGVAGMPDAYEAARLYALSMEKGFVPAMLRLGCVGLQSQDSDVQNQALEILARCRKAGDSRASYWIGRAAEMDNDLENAYEYYSEAAEEGYAPAQNALGIIYYEGKGINRDIAIAFQWFKMGADQGLPAALANLADLLLARDGITEEVLNLVTAASQGGEPKAEVLKREIERINHEEQEAERQRILAQRRAEEEEIKAREREEAIERITGKLFDAFGRLMGN